MKKIFSLYVAILFGLLCQAQILDVDPIFPTVEDTVTIIYDATQGNGGLVGISPVYTHAGLITASSTSPTDWKYVQTTWGQNNAANTMEDLGNNRHKIRYHIRSYYGVPMGEEVEQLAFVFRNADGSAAGRAEDGSDIYYPVYQAGVLETAILSPPQARILQMGDSIHISVAASDSSNLLLLLNSSLLMSGYGKSLDTTIVAGTQGKYNLVMTADNGTDIKSDSVYYLVRGPIKVFDPPVAIEPGINYLNDSSVILSLFAPNKDFIYVIGDFSEWQPDTSTFMNLALDGETWWVQLFGLTPGEEYGYQYLVDGTLKIGDPFCDKVLDPWNDQWIPNSVYPDLKEYPAGLTSDIVSVFQTAQSPYVWENEGGYTRPDPERMVVYELLIRDFVATHSYQTLIDTLDYLSNMGINAIELMPIMEFEGNSSWGYNPSYALAVDKYYGTKDDLKAFIDTCHGRGIAVILDMVLNHHFGQSPLVRLYWDAANNKPAPNNPWFNPDATHPFNVGYDFNHESEATKYYTNRVLRYWVEEFHFDGFRMDLSKGFTQVDAMGNVGAWGQYDASRIAILKDYADSLWSVDPDSYFILEHFAANNEETELINYGMMVWGNHNHNYNEGTMGWVSNSNFDWINYKNRGWTSPRAIGYMESHDEERLMYKNLQWGNSAGSYNIKDLPTALDRVELAANFFFPIPGPKLIWQFGEVGYDYSIDYNGRVGEKPIRWNYFEQLGRRDLYTMFSTLIQLRNKYEVFHTDDFTLNAAGAYKTLQLRHASMNVQIIGNFEVNTQNSSVSFPHAGMWYELFTGDSLDLQNTSMSISLEPGEFRFYTDQKLDETGTVAIEDNIEQQFDLRIWPNPFSDQLRLSFELEQAEQVQMSLWNLQGQQLRELMPAQILPTGLHNQDYSLDNLASGMYIVRMQAGNKQAHLPIIKE